MVSITNFSKSFGKRQVIHNLEFEVGQGEVFAFLGANGSGKTTTLRCLLGIYEPDSGELLINGDRYNQTMSYMLGYLPEERGLYLDASAAETIAYFGTLKGMSAKDASVWAANYMQRVDLGDKLKDKIKKLSSGQQQKIQLGVTLIGAPQLLILDEPTKGLDPVNRTLLMEMLEEMNKQHGTTIVFSTHQMEEAEQIADRLVMIKNGHRALYGSVADVKEEFGSNVVQLEYSGKLPASKLYKPLRHENNYAELEVAPHAQLNAIIAELLAAKVNITKIAKTTPSLHQIFVMVSKRDQ